MAAAALVLAGAIAAAARQKPAVNVGTRGELAVKGYDVVSYATEGRPVQGRSDFEYRWNGVVWRFATSEHREAFARAPHRFAPQFGGYCAYAVSRGYTADVDPAAWKIVDGKLYLNYSKRVQRLWEQDIPGNVRKAAANWPAVLNR